MKKMTKRERDIKIADWITEKASKIWKYGESRKGETLLLLPDSPDDLIIEAFQVTHFKRYWKKVGKTVELQFYTCMEDGELTFGAVLEEGPVVMRRVCLVHPADCDRVKPPVAEAIPENPAVRNKLKDLDMSIRARECLKAYGLELENATLEEFSYMSRKEVLGIPGIGRTTLAELVSILSDHGLSFRS